MTLVETADPANAKGSAAETLIDDQFIQNKSNFGSSFGNENEGKDQAKLFGGDAQATLQCNENDRHQIDGHLFGVEIENVELSSLEELKDTTGKSVQKAISNLNEIDGMISMCNFDTY
jgi:hypothetical protein